MTHAETVARITSTIDDDNDVAGLVHRDIEARVLKGSREYASPRMTVAGGGDGLDGVLRDLREEYEEQLDGVMYKRRTIAKLERVIAGRNERRAQIARSVIGPHGLPVIES